MIPHVKVQIDGTPIEVLDKARMIRYLNIAVEQFAAFGEREVKLRTPGAGVVRALWTTTFVKTSDGRISQALIHNTFSDPQELVLWLEGGTKPHDIFPKNGGLLAFYWSVISGTAFAKHVHHPGTKAYQMVEIAEMHMRANMHTFMGEFEKNLSSALQGKKK